MAGSNSSQTRVKSKCNLECLYESRSVIEMCVTSGPRQSIANKDWGQRVRDVQMYSVIRNVGNPSAALSLELLSAPPLTLPRTLRRALPAHDCSGGLPTQRSNPPPQSHSRSGSPSRQASHMPHKKLSTCYCKSTVRITLLKSCHVFIIPRGWCWTWPSCET